MRKYIVLLAFAIIFGFVGLNKASGQSGGDISLYTCCWDITVSTQITNDCCVEITVNNPRCDSVAIYFDKLNPNSSNYETKHIAPLGRGSVTIYKMCPENRESPLRYRVRISRYEMYEPACEGAWVEGATQFSGEVDLSHCCDCPSNPVSDWFTMTVERDPRCPDSSCRVVHHLNIPDSITCYKYYEYEGTGGSYSGQITPGFISNLDFCIGFGQGANATIALKRSENDQNPCYLDASARCDTLPYEPPLKEPCTPDCFETPFNNFGILENYAVPGCPGCSIKVNYTWRVACPPINYQDLQILNIQLLSPECNNCPINEIYKQALAQIIWNNPMELKPRRYDSCATIWRIVQGGCWAKWIYIVSDLSNPYFAVTVWEPCDSTECCLQRMTVCRYTWGIRIIPGQMYNQVDTCTMWKIDQWGNIIHCKPHCEWLTDLGGDYELKPAIILPVQQEYEQSSRITLPELKDMYGFRTSNTNSEFNVFVRSPESTDMTVEISDLFGNTLMSLTYQISKGEIHKTIDISKLRTGVFMFSVLVKGKKLWSGKFSIVR